MDSLDCQYVGRCGGCPLGARDFSAVLEAKAAPLRAVFPEAQLTFTPRVRVRDRVDLVWEAGRLGLYGLEERGVVDLEACPMMSEKLEAWFKDFRGLVPPIARGSVRLRVSPSGERGAWLDFANQDVKALFEEREYLRALSALAFVEIGQRRKALVWREDAPKLVDPELRPWFETYDAAGKAIPLYGPVGGFSQAGFAANRALVDAVGRLAVASGARSWLELFSGNGNFALALASRGMDVEALELEELAVQGMQRSAAESGLRVNVSRADVYLKGLPELRDRAVLVDPPRAGLRQILGHIEKGWQPPVLLYVSCFTESFLADAHRLGELGYKLTDVVGIDQFPYSPHAEWVTLFRHDFAISANY